MNTNFFITNAAEFATTQAKLISGSIPKSINGSYFRNGPGLFNYGNHVSEHWFNGDGYILKLGFKDGECTAQGKFVQTAIYKRRTESKSLRDSIIKKFWRRWKDGSQSGNPANTSILCLKNSPNLLATCQGGFPYVMKKQDLKCEGFNNFGWMTSAFSAHPKVDPQNGDIFNIGMSFPNMKIMRCTKDMKLICENQFKLRQIQSIHDFCLAGEFVILFEGPLHFNLKDMLWGNKFLFNCHTFDEKLPTLVHVYKKQDLQHIKTFDFQSFYSFHFTNGYNTDSKIVLQYIRYDIQVARTLFKLITDVPQFTQPNFEGKYIGASYLQQLTIDLKDFSTKTKSVKINGEFPVCEEREVGKQWRYTYAVGSQTEDLFIFDTIYKYDRVKDKLDRVQVKGEGSVHINEPCLIRTDDNLYIMCVINKGKRTYVHLYEAEQLKQICELELPQFIPPSFHGKWDCVGNDK